MMASLVLIFLVLVAVHAIYECILLPSIQDNLKYKLFKMRDDLRYVKIQEKEYVSEEIYQYLHEALNNSIRLVNSINFSTYKLSKIDHKDLVEIKKRRQLIETCPIEKVREIHQFMGEVVLRSLLANTGILVILYLMPVAFAIVLSGRIKMKIRNLINIPESKFEREYRIS